MSDERPADPRTEFAFIDWIRRRPAGRPEVLLGIGDDAALLEATGRKWIVTVDVVTEGVHFASDTPPELIGRKALAVNLSDLAAMAGEPYAALIGLVLPQSRDRSYAERIYHGLFDLASEYRVSIVGGDTNSWNGPLVISVTVLGLATEYGVVTRAGAQPGDWIFVTGALGGSLKSGRHLTFVPRVHEALTLHQTVKLHSLIDVSDGVGSDLFHLLDASRVGARLDGEAIPIHPDVDPLLPQRERLEHALGDGEDFELLFTVSPTDGQTLLDRSPLTIPLTKIGVITAASGATIAINGIEQELARTGWAHKFGT